MSVYKRGDVFYMNFTYMGTRVNKSSGKTTKTEALAEEERIKKEMREEALKPKLAIVTLSSAVRKCYDEKWILNRNGENSFRQAMAFVDLMGDIPITEVDTLKVRTASAALRKTGIAEATVNRYLAALRTSLNYTKHEVEFNMPHFALTKETGGRMKFYTYEEEDAIIGYFNGRGLHAMADCIRVLFDTGFRLSECLGINKKSTNGKVITTVNHKQQLVTSHINKGNKVRSVPMSPRVKEVLTRLAKTDTCIPFQFTKDQIEHHWKRMRRELGMSSDCVIHATRHTCASRLVQAGQPLQVVKEWLGHSSITTTEIYAHLAPNALRMAVGALVRPVATPVAPVANMSQIVAGREMEATHLSS